jgi:fibronectin type 3 domain-containing protein
MERTTYDERGVLDEVVANGSAHLELMSGGKKRARYFLSMIREDGTEIAIWFSGAVDMIEERPPLTTCNAAPHTHSAPRSEPPPGDRS